MARYSSESSERYLAAVIFSFLSRGTHLAVRQHAKLPGMYSPPIHISWAYQAFPTTVGQLGVLVRQHASPLLLKLSRYPCLPTPELVVHPCLMAGIWLDVQFSIYSSRQIIHLRDRNPSTPHDSTPVATTGAESSCKVTLMSMDFWTRSPLYSHFWSLDGFGRSSTPNESARQFGLLGHPLLTLYLQP